MMTSKMMAQVNRSFKNALIASRNTKQNTKRPEALSEIMGRYEHTKVETSQGTSRGFFSFLPKDRHEDARFSTENRYRVMPEEIIGLQSGHRHRKRRGGRVRRNSKGRHL